MKDYDELYDQFGPTGNRKKSTGYNEEDDGSFFDSMFEYDQYCDNCGYEGPLDSRTKGYTCPDCKELVIPAE